MRKVFIEEKIADYKIEGLKEEKVYNDIVRDFTCDMPNPAKECFEHALMEMLNNAIEHSGGTDVTVGLFKHEYSIEFVVRDNGVGIFSKIAEALSLDEKRHAILELAKGKFTTDPSRHSGEGIFFSSKFADFFALKSDGVVFITEPDSERLEKSPLIFEGTEVIFEVKLDHKQTLQEFFKQYTVISDDPKISGFIKTEIPIKLLEYGEERPVFISRSQARRLLVGIDRFKVVRLDFSDIDTIGQGFADEIFRVFKNAHPDIELVPINCSEAVHQMIRHALEYC
jgi:anti-sigma regulatory factor (Ser/Thr protein kinase)